MPELDMLAALEDRLRYRFHDRRLAWTALTDASYGDGQRPASILVNDRLAFLGDAVLGFVVAEDLFDGTPAADVGQLTKERQARVKNEHLLRIGEHLQLDGLLKKGRAQSGDLGKGRRLPRAVEAVLGVVYKDGGLEHTRRVIRRALEDSPPTTTPEPELFGACADFKAAGTPTAVGSYAPNGFLCLKEERKRVSVDLFWSLNPQSGGRPAD
jgi:dsRNA-specific ribonuclease